MFLRWSLFTFWIVLVQCDGFLLGALWQPLGPETVQDTQLHTIQTQTICTSLWMCHGMPWCRFASRDVCYILLYNVIYIFRNLIIWVATLLGPSLCIVLLQAVVCASGQPGPFLIPKHSWLMLARCTCLRCVRSRQNWAPPSDCRVPECGELRGRTYTITYIHL